uniref:hypothetical protein n=1 Tax=Flavobacterium myungsuense TaxID=651823 RepID=UPI0036D317EF
MPDLPIEVIYNSPPFIKDVELKAYEGSQLTVGYEGNITHHKGNQEKIFGISEICSQKLDFQFKIIGGNQFGTPLKIPKHLTTIIKQTGWVDYHSIRSICKLLISVGLTWKRCIIRLIVIMRYRINFSVI